MAVVTMTGRSGWKERWCTKDRLACLLSALAARIAWGSNGQTPLRLTRHQTDRQGGDKHTITQNRGYNGTNERHPKVLDNKLLTASALPVTSAPLTWLCPTPRRHQTRQQSASKTLYLQRPLAEMGTEVLPSVCLQSKFCRSRPTRRTSSTGRTIRPPQLRLGPE